MSIARPGADAALNAASPDLSPAVHRWIAGRPVGSTFTAAVMAEELPPHTIDKPVRLAAVISALNRTGHIQFAGYGPSGSHEHWDRPSRVWEVTAKGRGEAA